MSDSSQLVVGGGVFGLAAALELRSRGHAVTLIDPGPIPHPEASSTDISKAVRMDYGSDVLYTELAERCMLRWDEWNREFGETLLHEVGFLLLSELPMSSETFEGAGYELLRSRGRIVERIDPRESAGRFPAWNLERFVDGYFNPRGGWAPSGRVVELLAGRARDAGIEVREGVSFRELAARGGRVTGVVTGAGETIAADVVVLAAGAWTTALLPQLAEVMWVTGHPVFHFRPADPTPFQGERFPVWGADISRTGWYGFPAKADGIVKIGHHSSGIRMQPGDPKVVPADAEARFREFAARTFPALADAPIVGNRLCMYCDTWDGNFWIDRDPDLEGLVVACGGSGHGFKFVPILGELIADVVEGKSNPFAERFRRRERSGRVWEQARHHGDD